MVDYKAGISLVDDFGRVTTRSFIFSVADYAAGVALMTQFSGLYQACTELHLFETRLIDENAVGGSPISGANVDAGMSISAQLATANKKANIQIPAPVAAVIDADGSIDIAGTEMAALLAAYTQATNKVTASDGEFVTAWIRGTLDK